MITTDKVMVIKYKAAFDKAVDLTTFIKGKGQFLLHRMLAQPLRNFVIEEIKKPLHLTLLLVAKRFTNTFGVITKDNTIFRNTHCLIDIRDKFMFYENSPRGNALFGAAFVILLAENEHDPYYRDRYQFLIEEHIKKILSGEWEPRLEGTPLPKFWKESQPYGGKHSIIARIQKHRDEINAILNEEEK